MNDARRVSGFVLAVAVLVGLANGLVLPPWMGEDEPWHLEYAHYVSEGHLPGTPATAWTRDDLARHSAGVLWAHDHLATIEYAEAEAYQREVLESMREHRFAERVDLDPRHAEPRAFDDVQPTEPHYTAFGQPRLYYLLMGGLLRASGAETPVGELRVVRGFSLLCYVVTVAFALALAREVFDAPAAVLVCGLVVALFPMHARQAAVVNNDVLAKTLSAGVLWLGARFALGRGGLGTFVAMVLMLAVGLLAKTTAAGGIAVVGGAVVLRRLDADSSSWLARRGPTIAMLGAVVLVAGGALAYWMYSTNPAIPKTWDKLFANLDGVFTRASLLELWGSSVGATNWSTRLLPDAVYLAAFGAAALGLGGALVAFLRRRAWLARPGLVLCLVALAAQLALLVLRGEALGRYWIPALPAFAVLFAAGTLGAAGERPRLVPTTVAVLALALFEGWFLFGALVVNHYLVWAA